MLKWLHSRMLIHFFVKFCLFYVWFLINMIFLCQIFTAWSNCFWDRLEWEVKQNCFCLSWSEFVSNYLFVYIYVQMKVQWFRSLPFFFPVPDKHKQIVPNMSFVFGFFWFLVFTSLWQCYCVLCLLKFLIPFADMFGTEKDQSGYQLLLFLGSIVPHFVFSGAPKVHKHNFTLHYY